MKTNIGSRRHYRKRGFCDCGNIVGKNKVANEYVCDDCYKKDYTRFENARKRHYVRESDKNEWKFNPTPSPLLDWYKITIGKY